MHSRILWTAVALLLSSSSAVGAQVLPDADPGRSERTRSDLESLLEYYDEVLASPAYSSGVKDRVRLDAERVRARLSDGDFRAGDRIVLYVEGEPELPDTVAVQTGPLITLPLFGDISLTGVLRSEIESHLTRELGEFIRSPTVQARALMRVAILGAVGAPGFYTVPADMPLSEAVMAAGGLTAGADLEGIRIERGPRRLADGPQLQEAMREGLTLDQLNLQAGDQITLPERGGGFWGTIGVVSGIVGSLAFVLIQIIN